MMQARSRASKLAAEAYLKKQYRNVVLNKFVVDQLKAQNFNKNLHYFRRKYESPFVKTFSEVLKAKNEEAKAKKKAEEDPEKKKEFKLMLQHEREFPKKRMLEWFKDNIPSYDELLEITGFKLNQRRKNNHSLLHRFVTNYLNENFDFESKLVQIENILDAEIPQLEENGLGPILHTSDFYKPPPNATALEILIGKYEAVRAKAIAIMSLKRKAGLPVEYVHERLLEQVRIPGKYLEQNEYIAAIMKEDLPHDVVQHMLRLYGIWIRKEFRLSGNWNQPGVNLSEGLLSAKDAQSLMDETQIGEEKLGNEETQKVIEEYNEPGAEHREETHEELEAEDDIVEEEVLEEELEEGLEEELEEEQAIVEEEQEDLDDVNEQEGGINFNEEENPDVAALLEELEEVQPHAYDHDFNPNDEEELAEFAKIGLQKAPQIKPLTKQSAAIDLSLEGILKKKKELKAPAPRTELTDEEPIKFTVSHFGEREIPDPKKEKLITSKVKMEVKLSVFNLSPEVHARLVALAGGRYNAENDVLTIVGDKFANQQDNWKYTKKVFRELLEQAHLADPSFVPLNDLYRDVKETLLINKIPVQTPVDEDILRKRYQEFVARYKSGKAHLGIKWFEIDDLALPPFFRLNDQLVKSGSSSSNEPTKQDDIFGGWTVEAHEKEANKAPSDPFFDQPRYILIRAGQFPDPQSLRATEDQIKSFNSTLSSL